MTSEPVARRILGGATWNLLPQLVPVLVSISLTPYLVHGLGVARYGVYALVLTITVFLSAFDGGVGVTVQRYASVHAGTDDREATTSLVTTVTVVVLVIGSLLGAACWVAAPALTSLFKVPVPDRAQTVYLFRTVGLLLILAYLRGIAFGVVNARHRFRLTATATTVTYLAWAAMVVVVVHERLGLRGMAWAFVVQQAGALLVVVPAALRYLRRSIRLLPWRETAALLRFSANAQMMSIAGLVNNELNTVIIGAATSLRAVANYNTAANLSNQLRQVLLSGMAPASTHMGQTYGAKGRPALEGDARLIATWWTRGVSGFMAVGLGASYFGMTWWLGPQFRLAGLLVEMLLVGQWVNLLTAPLSAVVTTIGRPELELRYGLVAVVVNLVATAGLLVFGAVGVVAGSVIGTVVGSLYFFRVVRTRLGLDFRWIFGHLSLGRSALAAGVTVGGELVIRPYVPQGVVGLLCALGPAVVGLIAFAVTALPRRELRALRASLAMRSSPG